MIFVMLLFFCTLHYSQTEVLPSPFKISIAIPSLSFTPYTENINLQFLWLIVEYVVSYTRNILLKYQPSSKQQYDFIAHHINPCTYNTNEYPSK